MSSVPDWLEQRAKEAEEKTKAKAKQQIATVIQLPLWAEEKCGIPNGFLRSALFGAIRKGGFLCIKVRNPPQDFATS